MILWNEIQYPYLRGFLKYNRHWSVSQSICSHNLYLKVLLCQVLLSVIYCLWAYHQCNVLLMILSFTYQIVYMTTAISILFVLWYSMKIWSNHIQILIWFYWMFYDHFSARSLLAKLGRQTIFRRTYISLFINQIFLISHYYLVLCFT